MNHNPLLKWLLENRYLLDTVNDEDDLQPLADGNAASFPAEFFQEYNEKIPDVLPILPLRGIVVYPYTAVPLTIGQPRSVRLVDEAQAEARFIGLITSKDSEIETPGPQDLFQIGTVATIHRTFRLPDGTIRLLVQGLERFRVEEFTQTEPYLKAKVTLIPEIGSEGLEIEALARNARSQFEHVAELVASIPQELVVSVVNLEDPLTTVYTISNFQRMPVEEAQALLEIDTVIEKLHKLVKFLARESEVLELGQKIQKEARSEIEKVQRDYFLREQLKAIQRELGEMDSEALEVENYRTKIQSARMTEEGEKQAVRELSRLSKLPSASAEYGVIRTYLDWLVSLPWSALTTDILDIPHARQVLDQDHFGLEDVKERILEYLAVRKLRLERQILLQQNVNEDEIRREREGVILCFVGPPGVGKTSLGRSIARAMGRKFFRMSLGGVRDEAEIRGHRRTYIGALPGRILQALRRVESRNPVIMLDEIDKLGADFRGDPSSALLEVLDPEQNSEFRDHYMEVAFDLSQVMFITTANMLESIPGPLRDRMEIISISSYTEAEKVAIAQGYLIPRQLRENGLLPGEIRFTDEALYAMVRSYTREAGVRNLERQISTICRKIVPQIAEGKRTELTITPTEVREHLGRARFLGTDEVLTRTATPGVATGLAWTPTGGEVLFIEATAMPGGKNFQLTGSLGEVMQESARAALSYVRAKSEALGLDKNFFEKTDLHLHVPSASQPKDGPSAGVTMVTALISLISGKAIRSDIGMTGEITLRGQVLPVGGIKEKVLAAHRLGLKTIILPARNQADLEELPDEVRNSLEFIFANTVDDILQVVFESPSLDSAE